MRLGARVILCLAFLAGVSAVGATDPEPGRLTFIKSFRGSLPEYMRVTITRSGEAVYQGGFIEQPSEPETFHLSEATTERLFRLAAALNYFRGLELEYGRRVARLGDKTFRYEEAGERLEVRYNYTENATAQELQQWFERIGRGRYLNQQLEYTLAFDRLGVPAAMRDFERAFNAGELVDPEQFVPVLERVAEDTRVMRLARNRARDLLRRIRSPQSRLTIEHEDRRAGSYTKLVLDEQGRSSYEIRGLHQSSQAQPLNVPPAIHRRLLELVRVANYLGGYVSSGVGPEAAAGYRLTYEAGAAHNQVAFAQPPDAVLAEIVYLFQRLMYQQDIRKRLEAALDEESLTLQVVLQELEGAVRSNSLAEPKDFVPLLERIANGSHARVREQAERLLAQIQGGG